MGRVVGHDGAIATKLEPSDKCLTPRSSSFARDSKSERGSESFRLGRKEAESAPPWFGERVSLPDTSTIRIEDEKQPGVISYEEMTDANALGGIIGGLWRDIVLKLKDRSKVTL